jgi:uncharacterized protein (TIGR00299 family) protein
VRKVLWLEPFSGIAGDMTVGALLDLGVDFEVVREAVAALPVEGLEVSAHKVKRGALSCTKFEVRVHGEIEGPSAEGGEEGHTHDHSHGGSEHHHHDGDHDHGHGAHGDHGHRSAAEVMDILRRSTLTPAVRDTALRIFEHLAEAEARVHGTTALEVVFHEVGALDALADVVATAAALDALGVMEVRCGPVRAGSGMVRTAHGRLPVPAPATLQCLLGFELRLEEGAGELVTPTGAAILAAVARPGAPEGFRAERTGYGAGTRDGTDVPNCLRATVGRTPSPALAAQVFELAVNLDDVPAQVTARAAERLLEAGALDVWTETAGMKKGRAGVVLRALVEEPRAPELERLLMTETGSLGVRRHAVFRTIAERRHETVSTPFGPIRMKIGSLDGEDFTAAPEYEDCRAAAEKAGVPVREVRDAALAAGRGRSQQQ